MRNSAQRSDQMTSLETAAETRHCRRCELDLPATDFHRGSRDTPTKICKTCISAICGGQIFTMNANEATTLMARLESGEALRTIVSSYGGTPICSKKAFEMHCDLHPKWGAKARALAKANSRSRILQGVQKRVSERTHCRNGHELTAANTKQVIVKRTGWRHLECQTCRTDWDKRGRFTAEQIDAVEAILNSGGTLKDATARKSNGGVIKFTGLAAAFRGRPKLAARLKRLSAKNVAKKRSKVARARRDKNCAAARLARVAARAQALVQRAAVREAARAAKREGKRLPKASWEARYQLVAARTGKWTSYCRCCENELPLANFYPGMRGGVTRTCMSCTDDITGGRIVFTMNANEANRFIERLEAGETLRLLLGAKGAICSKQSFLKHCEMHPEWAKRVQELATRNATEALKRKGNGKAFANKTHCSKGHPLTPGNVGIKPVNGTRYCKTCNSANVARGKAITPEIERAVRNAVLTNMRICDIYNGTPGRKPLCTYGTLRTARRLNPDLGRFFEEKLAERKVYRRNNGGLLVPDGIGADGKMPPANDIPVYIHKPGDHEWFYSLTPRWLSMDDRLDIVSNIYVALGERRLRAEDVPQWMKKFTKEQTDMFATRADGKKKTPLSLNQPIFLDGKTTLIDSITTPLWSDTSIYYER